MFCKPKKKLFVLILSIFSTFIFTNLKAQTLQFCYQELPQMSLIDHPVSTNYPKAQKNFNKGLSNLFAFNHDLAYKQFKKASEIDPNLSMAFWGMALALGQNINNDVTPENEKKCYQLAQKALQLSNNASPSEKAYIKALATRYTDNPSVDLISLRYKYRDAMKKVVQEYNEDLDAASLYAESILDLNPWDYWTFDGKPKEGTTEAIEVLESIMKRNPYHIGANHYIIHAWEGSKTPERALISAYRLTALTPKSGHLLHMPCHIFLLLGYYEEAINTSMKAIAADEAYIGKYGNQGYPLHYTSHNYSVLVRSFMLAENFPRAINAARRLFHFISPYIEKDTELSKFLVVPLEVNLYFHHWENILDYEMPKAASPFAQAYWHFSRAMAYIHLNQMNAAQKEKQLWEQAKEKVTDDEEIAGNPPKKIFAVAQSVLAAAFAESQGNRDESINHLLQAVSAQDQLAYNEPPGWYFSTRSQLGKAYLLQKRYQEAKETFETALQEFPRNGRLLFGTYLSLKGLEQPWNNFWIQREMQEALRLADKPLFLNDL